MRRAVRKWGRQSRSRRPVRGRRAQAGRKRSAPRFYFHGTTLNRIPGIAKYGLLPHSPSRTDIKNEPRIFVTLSEKSALRWAGWDRKGERPVVLRFPREQKCRVVDVMGDSTFGWHELFDCSIKPNEIEVRKGGRWMRVCKMAAATRRHR